MICPLKFNSNTLNSAGYLNDNCLCELEKCEWYVANSVTFKGECCIKRIMDVGLILERISKLRGGKIE